MNALFTIYHKIEQTSERENILSSWRWSIIFWFLNGCHFDWTQIRSFNL